MKSNLARIVAGGALVLGLSAFTSGLTHQANAQMDQVAYDGQTFASQSASTQQQFTATWGADAANHWLMEHNNGLLAAGYVVPQNQSGAQVNSAPSSDNRSNDNGNGDNNSGDNNSGDNNSGDNNDNG